MKGYNWINGDTSRGATAVFFWAYKNDKAESGI
jgi:hypothetical protein